MATVEFISRSTVLPSSSSSPAHSKRRIDLSQWDTRLLFIHYIQYGLIYPRHQITATATVIQSLKSSLSRVLNFFYPLAGRLAATANKFDRTTSFRIECNDAGVEFVHAKAADDSVTVAQVMDCGRVPPSLISSLFGLNGVKNVEGVSKPLLSVQVTELVDGLFLACSVNHAVADGTSFWHFLNSWSQISRGMETISIYPDLQRAYSGFPIWVDTREETQRSFTPPPLAERVFHFTAENVMKLKLKARAQIRSEVIQISALQSVLAHVWRAVVVANSSHLDAEDEVQLRIPINWRPRLEPPLSDSFFGNAMHSEGVACKVRDVTDSALGHLALKVNRMVASQKDAVAKEFLQKWMEGPNLVSLSHASKYMTIMFGSPRFDVYGMNFGWGRPVGVRSGPANKVGGTVRVYPGKQDGSVDTEVSLPLDALNGMGKDEEFMKFVSQE